MKYSYKVISYQDEHFNALMDNLQKLGDDGWDCFSIVLWGTTWRAFLKKVVG